MLFMTAAVFSRNSNHEFSESLECGKISQIQLGDRHFYLRLPTHQTCADASHPLPLVVLIHCYGCSALMEIDKFSSAADRLGFGLAAPEGTGRSFNSPSCCGQAKDERLPDVAFIDSVAAHALNSLSPPRFHASAVFAAGFSNGGFLTSYLADESRTAWAGLAPIAGHEYELKLSQGPMPVSIHHCASDNMVNASGCCMLPDAVRGSRETCCCGITASRCVPTRHLFDRWLKVNQCRGSKHSSLKLLPHAACHVGVGCAAETALCMHGMSGTGVGGPATGGSCFHSQWSRDFSAGAEEVLAFFARQACTRQGGHTDENALVSAGACHCSKARLGPHCMQARPDRAGSPRADRDEHRALRSLDQSGYSASGGRVWGKRQGHRRGI